MLLKEETLLERASKYGTFASNPEILTLKDFTAFSLAEVNKRSSNILQIILNSQNILMMGFESGTILVVNYNQLFSQMSEIDMD